jgi:hypothetical protein
MAYARSTTWIAGPGRGIGAYPDETCFDPTRPSLLPYWVDDLTESSCWWNEVLWGNTTGNTAQVGQPGVAPETITNTQAQCAAGGGSWDSTNLVCNPSLISQLTSGPVLLTLGLIAVAGFLFSRGK